MKCPGCLVSWFFLVGLLGLVFVFGGLQRGAYPNGWLYVGAMLLVAAVIALLCLFVWVVVDLLRSLHPLVEVGR